MIREATISECGIYRTWLLRRWGVGTTAVFVMLNPSTADAAVDDPTIRRCIKFAQSWGDGAIEVVNLYSYRTTYPVDLVSARHRGIDVIGMSNDAAIAASVLRARIVVAAWGAKYHLEDGRSAIVISNILRFGIWIYCLARTDSGYPMHPMARGKSRIPDDTNPVFL